VQNHAARGSAETPGLARRCAPACAAPCATRPQVFELAALRRQLAGGAAAIPGPGPIAAACDAFDALQARLAEAQALRAGALKRELAGLDLPLLELRLRRREGGQSRRHGCVRGLRMCETPNWVGVLEGEVRGGALHV
jgi:hypothetical protein